VGPTKVMIINSPGVSDVTVKPGKVRNKEVVSVLATPSPSGGVSGFSARNVVPFTLAV
jgi:hypothetical protein